MESTKDLLNFLEQSELNTFNDIENINTKIQDTITKQDQKAQKISSIKEEISKIDIPALTKDNKKEYYISQLDKISETISSNKKDLSSLLDSVKEYSSTFESFKNNPDSEIAKKLKENLSSYTGNLSSVEFNISTVDAKIDTFIKELAKIDESLNFIEPESVNQEDLNIVDNNTLIISEKDNCVFLPYTVDELNSYLTSFPDDYSSLTSVINKEFVLPLNYFSKHPTLARFREAYSLMRDKEAKSVFESLKYSSNIMLKYDLNPAIISACRTENTLNHYVDCLESNKLDNFNAFKIEYRMNPITVVNQDNI